MNKIFPIILVAAVGACAGASVRVVETSKQGGELELIGSREKAMELAKTEMAKACGGAYEVVEEGEYVATVTPSGTTYAAVNPLEKRPDKIEWHTRYTCGAASTADASADASTTVSDAGPAAFVRSFSVAL